MLVAPGIALGFWRPRAALFAFNIYVIILLCLAQSALLDCVSPPSIVFCATYIGIAVRQLIGWTTSQKTINSLELQSNTQAADSTIVVLWIVDLLITAVLCSLVVEILRHRSQPGFLQDLWIRPIFGFGDSYYFISSAFLWLQGLFFFRLIVALPQTTADTTGSASTWIALYFATCIIVLLVSFLLQTIYQIPITPDWFAGMVLGVSLPYEDSHAYGSVAAAAFAYAAATWSCASRAKALRHAVITAVLFGFVVASWSRAAWVAAIMALIIVALQKLPLKWSSGITAGVVAGILGFSWARRDSWGGNPFLFRLENLVRIDQPRIYLYHKAFGMIRERPLLGHGIGASHNSSVRFAQAGDPLANVPEFMHNFILQIATEQGSIIAALYVGLIVWVLWRGFRASIYNRFLDAYEHKTAIAASIALATYLLTQMTANSLNVYISNQFFFWFLLAAIFSATATSNTTWKMSWHR